MTGPAPEPAARIAVVIPCFNDGATVTETVESVRQQEPCELVVVDDGSTDAETLRVMDELEAAGVTVVHQENRGLSAARMAGVAATSAPYVLPLDADDALTPGALGPLADVLDRDPSLGAAWGDTLLFGEAEGQSRRRELRLDPWRITYFNGLPYSALFRRDALLDVGGWDLQGGYEDWDLWLALAERGHLGRHVRRPVLRYRIHGQRMWADAQARHDRIYRELQRRHPSLFAERPANWRHSPEPWRVKLLLPLIARLPRLSTPGRRRLYAIADDPRGALVIARHRFLPGSRRHG